MSIVLHGHSGIDAAQILRLLNLEWSDFAHDRAAGLMLLPRQVLVIGRFDCLFCAFLMVSYQAPVAILLRPLRRQCLQRLLVHEWRVIHDHVALGSTFVRLHSRLSYRRRSYDRAKLMLEFIHCYRILKGTGDLPLKVVVVE